MLDDPITHGMMRSAFGAPQDKAQRDDVLPHAGCPRDTRNLFSTAEPTASEKRFRGLGCLSRTVQEMAPLAQAMCKPGAQDVNGTGGLPAGYTYLAQLVAHDIAVRAGGTPEGRFDYHSKSPEEDFLKPMTLASVYGPEGLEKRVASKSRPGFCRVHAFERTRALPGAFAGFDFARGEASRAAVYDNRNDDLPLLSQTCALFLGLHNHCAARLTGRFAPDDIFGFARMLTTEVYQRIVKTDLMGTLLHPAIAGHYQSEDVLIDRSGAVSPLPAVEFTHGAFRFGHAMVRPYYRLQHNRAPIMLQDLLVLPTNLVELREHDPAFWRVDLRMFFGEGGDVQRSGRLEPALAPFFAEAKSKAIAIKEDLGSWRDDLAMRDLARSADSGLLSVSAMAEHLAPYFRNVDGFADWLSFQPDDRSAALSGWMTEHIEGDLPEDVAAFLASDPPLYFYVLFEASLPVAKGGGDGNHLGVLGSILVAESVLPSIKRAGLSFDDGPKYLKARSVAFDDAEPPATMLGLLSLLS